MLREIKGTQRLPRLLAARFTGAGAIQEGSSDITVTRNGAGDYSIAYASAFSRKPVIVATCATADCYAELVDASNLVSGCQILTKNNADAATDAIVHVMILGWDSEDAV